MFVFDYTLVVIVGLAVAIVSILVKIIGFPDQFLQNHKRKSTEGLSFWFAFLSFVAYILWMIYGWLQNDWVVFLAQGVLGSITAGAILVQFFLYRKNHDI